MQIRIIESLRITTPLGLRFRDIVTSQIVRSGLRVIARLENYPNQFVIAKPTSAGIYTFHHMQNLRDIEHVEKDLQLHELGSFPTRYIVQVEDLEKRYLPITFIVSAPRKGIFPNGEEISSPPGLSAFDLFSEPSRLAPGGFTEVRADLKDIANELPAAHALVEVQTNGTSYFGLSDLQGKAVVMLPYPPIEVAGEDSPVIFDNLSALSQQEWPVYIKVRYAPEFVKKIDDIEVPNLKTVLSQTEGVIYRWPGSPIFESAETLIFAHPLVLRTEGRSSLIIGRSN